MATHGDVTEFDATTEEWATYVERLEQYFVANAVTEEGKKRAILLSACGAPTYRLIRSLVAPTKPGEKAYGDIIQLVANHHNPKPSAIVQRFKINCRVRGPKESVAAYVAALRHLTEHCAYGTTLDDMLRDRIVCGINDSVIQRRLLGEEELTFARAYEIAQSMESAAKNSTDMQSMISNPSPTQPVHSVEKKELDRVVECFRCGGHHFASACQFKNSDCNACGKKGHIARVCRSRSKSSVKSRQTEQPGRGTKAKGLHTMHDECLEDVGNANTVYALKAVKPGPFIVKLHIHGVCVPMELDTDASLTIMSKKMFDSLWAEGHAPKLNHTSTGLRTYTGEPLRVLGVAVVNVVYKEQQARLQLLVVKEQGPCLLGRNWLRVIKLDWSQIHMVQGVCSLQHLLSKHECIFKEELGTMKGVVAKFVIDPAIEQQPQFYKPRSLPFIMKEKIELELERLKSCGIISPVQFSDWAAPIVPVVKRDGTVRICGDYKLTINRVVRLVISCP